MLKSLYRNENWNIAVVSQLMASTYIAQRQDFVGVEPMSVTDVKTEWPFLLEAHWFVQHLTRLLGFNITEKMDAGIAAKLESLVKFFKLKSANMKGLKKRLCEIDWNISPAVAVVPLIMTYFKENESTLFHGYEVCLY